MKGIDDMEDQKKICITEEELLEMVDERVRKRRIQRLGKLPDIMWICGLVTVSILAGYAVVESVESMVIFIVVLSVVGVAGPSLIKRKVDMMSEDDEEKDA